MSLRDELGPVLANGGVCSVKAFVSHQANAEEWIELLDDRAIQHSQIYRLMKSKGFDKTANPVTRHRNGQCSCGGA